MPNNLFLQKILSGGKSGLIELSLPDPDISKPYTTLRGYLAENAAPKLGNSWQQVLPSPEAYTKLTNMLTSSKDVVTWLAGAQSAWVGSEALTIPISFYLFSIDENSKIKKEYLKLAGLSVPNVPSSGGTQDLAGTVHGGYKPDILNDTSADYVQNNVNNRGFITIRIGSQLVLTKMLLVDTTPEYSMLEVKDGNPLYIKVNATFKSYRPLSYDELALMINP